MHCADPDAPPVAGVPPPASRSSRRTNNPANVYEFGQKNGKPDGSMSITIQATATDLKFGGKAKSIWKNGAPYTGDDLHGTMMVRTTDNGCFGGSSYDVDCTIIDFPVPISLTCSNGSCKLPAPVVPTSAVFPASVSFGESAIHPGDATNIEIGQIAILDEDGDAVARGGLYVP